ncbi:MAG: hypothetical protein R3F47_04925 [Gammaproteobacteria bacterium]
MEPKARHWKKHGLVYVPDGQVPWARSHAQLPLVQQHDDFWRIYFATRNEQGQSNISYIETDAGDPHRIRRIHDGVLLPFGDLGTFDESGIMPLSLVPLGNGRWYLYYAGWTQRKTIPYHNSIGIAVSDDDGLTFRSCSRARCWMRVGMNPTLPVLRRCESKTVCGACGIKAAPAGSDRVTASNRFITSNMQNQTMVLIGVAKAGLPLITPPRTKAVSAARPFIKALMVLKCGIATAMPLTTVTILPTVIASAMQCRMTASVGTVVTRQQVSMYQPRVGIA